MAKAKKDEAPKSGRITVNRNKKGEIISYRFRCCVGRGTDKKQILRSCTVSRPDGLTPAKERKEVERLADAWEQEQRKIFERTHEKIDRRKIGYKEFVEKRWLKNHVLDGQHTPNGIAFFKASSKTSVDFFGSKKLNEIDLEAVEAYLRYLNTEARGKSGKPLSASTQQHHFSTLNNVMQYAWRLEYISENPCQRLGKDNKPSANKTHIDFLSPADARRFLNCLDSEYRDAQLTGELGTIRKFFFWRLYGYLLITAGLRRGEAVGLKWSDIDAKRLQLNISRSVCSDKTQPTGMLIKGTKTGESRYVPILQELYDMFVEFKGIEDAYFDRRTEEEKKSSEESFKLPEDTFIFCSESDPDIPVYCTSPTRYFSKFVKRHNLPDVSPHDLRHTAASLALESGANMKQIAELMGHHDIGVTSQFYAALTAEAERRTVEGIGGLLFDKKPSPSQEDKKE